MNATILVPVPQEVPKDLTKLSKSYMLQSSLAVFSIVLFFTLYVLLIIGLGYLVYFAFTYEIENFNKFTILGKLGAIAGSIMLLLFTLKFVLKLKNPKPTNRIKLSKSDYPELFLFIDTICKETGAPKPKSIYVDPDVNAYVAYTNVWLSLFLPTKKDLTIGLGLVSALNLSEFKAVMAHEFGHFAQKSMKIGSYIHSANTIIHGMIFTRDKYDDMLDKWRNSDIRLSFAAWIITPIIWLIRQVLRLFYVFLNMMHSALSREMEFNADKVAVKTVGSEAIVSGLWKLEFGFENWSTIVNNAYHASKKYIFTKNLYAHKNALLEKTKEEINTKFELLSVDTNGNKNFFSQSENSKVSMYASHPPNDLREKSAKKPFVLCEIDKRSPWILFNKATELQEEMTLLIYKMYLGKAPESHSDFTIFEKFIEAENKNSNLFTELENTFENRFINMPNKQFFLELNSDIENPMKRYEILKSEIKELMKPVKELESLMIKTQQIASGVTKDKTIEYKSVTYNKKNLQTVFDILLSDREFLFNNEFKVWDEKYLSLFYFLAQKEEEHLSLLKLYIQQKEITNLYQFTINTKNKIITSINDLQKMGEVSQEMVDNLSNEIKSYVKFINEKINSLDTLDFVPLPNIDNITELKEAIVEKGQIENQLGRVFENGKIDKILFAIDSVISNCNRIENKNLEEILKTHNKLIN